jgi:hypothetical protein
VSGSSTADVGGTKITSNPRRLVYVAARGDLVSITDIVLLIQGLSMIAAHLSNPRELKKKNPLSIFKIFQLSFTYIFVS